MKDASETSTKPEIYVLKAIYVSPVWTQIKLYLIVVPNTHS